MARILDKLKKDAALRHRTLKWFWLAMAVPTLLWFKDSVLWVSLMSLYANYEASAAAEEASRGKTK
jgi:hypothetical protein